MHQQRGIFFFSRSRKLTRAWFYAVQTIRHCRCNDPARLLWTKQENKARPVQKPLLEGQVISLTQCWSSPNDLQKSGFTWQRLRLNVQLVGQPDTEHTWENPLINWWWQNYVVIYWGLWGMQWHGAILQVVNNGRHLLPLLCLKLFALFSSFHKDTVTTHRIKKSFSALNLPRIWETLKAKKRNSKSLQHADTCKKVSRLCTNFGRLLRSQPIPVSMQHPLAPLASKATFPMLLLPVSTGSTQSWRGARNCGDDVDKIW